ncbi:outer membrane protein assembly factor [Gillisia sp. M10.2A]|uniref:Outer membrane protein assembly factor n=1 Tax=Gillisia lutea TaxID=2909668 RepID=A0ABS9EJ48_9FLAO|nr:BamA/TamA family outer membrane protein [Gillisia lutea]MCF4102367.1 outer membrane protein assembly factor [Gillisia lutea]
MKRPLAKISLFILTLSFLISCNAVKRVENDQLLLTENTIFLNNEKISEPRIYNQLYQEPNARLLGTPLRLHFYNLAKKYPDSSFQKWLIKKPNREDRLNNIYSKKQVVKLNEAYVDFNNWIKKTGEAPVIIDEELTKKSVNRLKAWYFNNGWFNVETDYEIKVLENKKKRGEIEYSVISHKPYIMDSIFQRIDSKVIDSLYQVNASESIIKPGVQYKTLDINAERDRLTRLFRNNGVYFFDQEYISFEADTVDTNHKVNTTVIINNRQVSENDVSVRVPFKIHKISKVNVFTDYTFANRYQPVQDSIEYNGYTIYSFDELEYKPRAITDAIFIRPGKIFKDTDRTRTYNRMSSLRVFKYPNIEYTLDPTDTTNTDLVANIFLTPQPKYSLGFDFDISQSNIQDFGIGFGGSLLIRNVFKGAENFEISGRGSVGSSSDAAKGSSKDNFFNISEIGADIKLTFPRIFLPFDTEKFIPKFMSPFTSLSLGISTQNNIGLDKQNLNGILNYRWSPSRIVANKLDLLNIQYVRNLNTGNYFNVYKNSYNTLNNIVQSGEVVTNPNYLDADGTLIIPEGAENFIQDVVSGNTQTSGLTADQKNEINGISERKNRLTENNLIFASNFTYTSNNKENLYDEDFSRFRFKVETAGNLLSAVSSLTGASKNEQGSYDVVGVNFSQYVKTEIDYIKHWDWGHKNILAIRGFGGIAIPYGNANSIPFIRSFFAGGPNDNRAWQAYDLGPGSSGGRNEFNEANLKLAFNAEYRYNLFGALNSAFFIDIGNIWNVLDIVEDEASTFTSLADLKDIAIGSGAGLRYDFNFFVLRLDVGFKTYDPSLPLGERWFKNYNFSNAVYNVGINYPF